MISALGGTTTNSTLRFHDSSIHHSSLMPKQIEIVVAIDRRRGMGYNGTLPWPRLPLDMTHFRVKTTTNSSTPTNPDEPQTKFNGVVMGRKTWDSLPLSAQPLPGRINIVITSKPDELKFKNGSTKDPNVIAVKSFQDAIIVCDQHDDIEKIVVIGGHQPICDALKSPRCSIIHLTEVLTGNYPCDVFLPKLPDCFQIQGDIGDIVMDGVNKNIPTQYFTYVRPAPQNKELSNVIIPPQLPTTLEGEQGYLDLINYCIHYGKQCDDRTGVGTRSLFGNHIRYNLRNGSFPLFTTKRVFFRGVLKELLWFIQGSTNSNLLTEQKIHIWDGNSTREFLDKRGLSHREVGDLGPVYGFQWRHFGAEYKDFSTDYTGQGFDQLADLIHLLKTQPDSRRLIMSAWNPPHLNDMALPPCHVLCQFRVYDNKELHCLLYQRSCDLGLGVPFNVASYSLLTYMLAHLCGLEPGELVHVMGDIHVYNNHIEPLQQQLIRVPQEQPTLRIARRIATENDDKESKDVIHSVDDFVFEDFIVENYKPDAPIKMDMAV